MGMAASPPITIVAWLGIDTVQAVMHAATTAIVATVMILCTLSSSRTRVDGMHCLWSLSRSMDHQHNPAHSSA